MAKVKVVKIGGKLVGVYTIAQLAKAVNRSTITLRKMEERGLLPVSNFRMPSKKLQGGSIREGDRIYSEMLVRELTDIFKGISQGVKIPESTLQKIKDSFAKEKEYYGS